jgi:hypothetical protein
MQKSFEALKLQCYTRCRLVYGIDVYVAQSDISHLTGVECNVHTSQT